MIGLVAATLSFAACSNPKHFNEDDAKYDPSLSKAMNLALLTGLTTRAGPLQDNKPVQITKKHGGSKVSSFVMLGAQTSGALFNGGMGIGASVGLSRFAMLSGSPSYNPIFFIHHFAWMPTNMARNEDVATDKMTQILFQAMKAAVPSEGKVLSISPPEKVKLFQSEQAFSIKFIYQEKKYVLNGDVSAPEKVAMAPDGSPSESWYWLYRSTGFEHRNAMITMTIRVKEGHHDRAPDGDVEQELRRHISSLLPSWVYTYIPPNDENKQHPYFLNQGKVLSFSQPIAPQ